MFRNYVIPVCESALLCIDVGRQFEAQMVDELLYQWRISLLTATVWSQQLMLIENPKRKMLLKIEYKVKEMIINRQRHISTLSNWNLPTQNHMTEEVVCV